MIFIGMKKALSILLLTIMLVTSVSAVDLWFKWTPNPTNEMVTSYVIQQASGNSTNFFDVVTAPGTTNVWPIRGLGNGSYKFRLIAVNGVGRSIPSSVLSYPTNTPSQPTNFQIVPGP